MTLLSLKTYHLPTMFQIIFTILIMLLSGYTQPSKSLSPVIYNDQLNTYTNKAHQFSVQYPNHLDIHMLDKNSTNFSEKGTDGPWLIHIQAKSTEESTVYKWVKSENTRRKNQPPIRIIKEEKHERYILLYLKIPVVMDQSMDGKPIYVDQDSAILIKEKTLYTFLLRTQVTDQKLQSDFQHIIESFRFMGQ